MKTNDKLIKNILKTSFDYWIGHWSFTGTYIKFYLNRSTGSSLNSVPRFDLKKRIN